jgi:hypothetical protein
VARSQTCPSSQQKAAPEQGDKDHLEAVNR